jgi:hypothetical protein
MDLDHEDLLIQRALAGTAADEDWNSLDALGARDPSVWERLARALRDDRELAAYAGGVAQAGEAVEIAPARPAARPTTHRTTRLSSALGWLAAAAVALVATLAHVTTRGTGVESLTPHGSASETIAELPQVLLESRPGPNGVEVYFVKRSIQRAVVGEIREVQKDDAGNSVAVPLTLTSATNPSTL